METIKKQRIAVALRAYADRYGSQSKAAKALKMSATVISQMLSGDWESLADKQWHTAATGIGYREERWEAVMTADFSRMTNLLSDARENSLVLSVTGQAGTGKTFACKTFAETCPSVYHLSCDSFWTRKDLMMELLTAMGQDTAGLTLGAAIKRAVRILRMTDRPLIILDEADKLSDTVLNSFITLYNQLEDICGIVLIATSHLEKKLIAGVRHNKMGYNEIWSRLGRRCIPLSGVSAQDIVMVCEANGITDPKVIDRIITDSDSDLRRVARRVHAERKKMRRTPSEQPSDATPAPSQPTSEQQPSTATAHATQAQ